MEFSLGTLVFLFGVALIAGWVDTLAGGGGLLTVPALLLTGMPPASAIATNKLQGSCGTLVATTYFLKQGAIQFRTIRWLVLTTFLGSVIGSWLVLKSNTEFLVRALPILLVLVGCYVLMSPNIDDTDKRHTVSLPIFAISAAPTLGFYDGFFGPGTGSFIALSLVTLCGYGLSKATANAKILNFTSNFSSLLYFILFGQIVWIVGGVMIIGQAIGAAIAARMVMKVGAALIKPIVVTVCFLMAIRIFWQTL
ncbi:TSUP family transporter [Oscillatoria sp. CS-180]|uniref:TSUP family transporter n=1 Tax=Oscillatoria sp. CS-180 TaxID=3021720 RepID=UPI00232D6DAA|nr:TSUP family transporter [Oscillatoria sp. CS-180]MDB9527741.1 TSUP family transporter [Oscillatoria sp. CS-180]